MYGANVLISKEYVSEWAKALKIAYWCDICVENSAIEYKFA